VPLFTFDDMRIVAALPAGLEGEARLTYRPGGVILRQAATAGGWLLLLAALGCWALASRGRREMAMRLVSSGFSGRIAANNNNTSPS
jgi:hypothetical protein